MTRLFTDTGAYTDDARGVQRRLVTLLQPIFEEDSFDVRDLTGVAMSAVMMSCNNVVMRGFITNRPLRTIPMDVEDTEA